MKFQIIYKKPYIDLKKILSFFGILMFKRNKLKGYLQYETSGNSSYYLLFAVFNMPYI